jgi:hypothetical protein
MIKRRQSVGVLYLLTISFGHHEKQLNLWTKTFPSIPAHSKKPAVKNFINFAK